MPIKGAGIGLRAKHYRNILEDQPPVPWLTPAFGALLPECGQNGWIAGCEVS